MKPVATLLTGFLLSASLLFAGDVPAEPVEAKLPAQKTPRPTMAPAPRESPLLDQLEVRLESAKNYLSAQLASSEPTLLVQNREADQRRDARPSDDEARRPDEPRQEEHDAAAAPSESSRRRAEEERLRELRATLERLRNHRRARETERDTDQQPRPRREAIIQQHHREVAVQQRRDDRRAEDHFRVGDLMATVPGQSKPVFASPEALIRTVRTLADTMDGQRGQLDFAQRTRVLHVTGRPEFIRRVRDQLNRFRRLGSDRIRVTTRLLFVPNHARMTGSRDAARLLSGDRRDELVEEYEGDVGKPSRRDYVGHQAIASGQMIYLWTSHHREIPDAHRGVNVVIRTTPDGNAVTIAPIPLAGDESKVDWRTLRVTPGQCVAYELPAVAGSDDERDETRVIAFITVDAIIPGD